jgi:serine/threonine protein kinase
MKISSFDLQPGERILKKYEVAESLGSGWEGEVYRVVEIGTGIERAAKLFYPHRNLRNRTSSRYARKLHKLRHCSMLVQYHTEERLMYHDTPVTALISEYVEGRSLTDFLKALKGRRLTPFEAVHLLYVLARGLEEIHQQNEYHGDLHPDNIIIRRHGITFDVKVLDFYHWEATRAENRQDDVVDLIKTFHFSLGGRRYYASQPAAIKYICCGLKRSLIRERFKSISHLCKHLETMEW